MAGSYLKGLGYIPWNGENAGKINHNTQKGYMPITLSYSLLKRLINFYFRSIFTPQNFRWTHNAYQEVKSVEKAYIFGTTKNTLDKKIGVGSFLDIEITFNIMEIFSKLKD